ncbi:MAG: ABC transporter permease [Nanoarchaeota archaeon]|nr:ABC transporter permease [Nanoarchaeota archaeon]
MRISKCLKHAFNMVVHSKLRSWLTIIGIVIGVGAVIAIVSLSESAQQEMESQLSGLGGDLITLTAGFSRGGGTFGRGDFGGGGAAKATKEEVVLDRTDIQALKGIPEIAYIETEIRGTVEVSYLGRAGKVTLTGVDQKVWSHVTTSTLADGRFLDPADQNVVVIGGGLASSYFDQPVGINKMLSIENRSFRVVGIIDDNGRSIYMPIQMAFQVIPEKDQGIYDSIIIKVKNEDTVLEDLAKIEQKLMMVRHVNNRTKDFSLSSNKQMQATRAELMSTMSMFLIALAAVSLIVGAVGIANTMFTSVLEKTKDIGIMKAIGARNSDILIIFLFNSAIIGLVGGILGIIFGGILSGFIPALLGDVRFLRGGGFVSMNAVIMAVSVSILVGLLAGAIPAWKASRLKPVDALRYE